MRALFVTYGAGHVQMVIPVVEELRHRKGWESSVLGLTTARRSLELAGIPALGFRDLILDSDGEALARGRDLARTNHTEGMGIDYEESVAYLGLSYMDLARRVGDDEAARRYGAKGRGAFLPLDPLERLFRRIRPDVVVATSSPRAEEAAIRVARRLGIPSICMIDLFALTVASPHLREPGYADRVTVFSEMTRDVLLAHGRNPREIAMTGNPAFDRLAQPDLPERAALWRRQHHCEGRIVVLLASQPEPGQPDLERRIFETIAATLPRHPDWYLVHRPHPNSPWPEQPAAANICLSDSREEIPSLLAAIDIVVSMNSTIALEACLVGKPFVKMCLSQFDAETPFEKIGIALPAYRLEEVESRIVAALSPGPEAGSMAAARKRLPPVGRAAARVADVMEELVRPSP
jgi:hypothetical protein